MHMVGIIKVCECGDETTVTPCDDCNQAMQRVHIRRKHAARVEDGFAVRRHAKRLVRVA